MQGYLYSIFSLVAIAIHLMVNFDLLVGRGRATAHGARYRGFLLGVLAYYVADGAWGVFAGLGWTRCLYVDTVLFFLANAVFAFMWCRFVVVYLGLGRWTARALSGLGCALLAANVLLLAANAFNGCVFSFDAQGKYLCGVARDPLFYLLIAFNLMISLVVLAKTVFGRDSARSRNMMAHSFTSAPILSCQSAPALLCATMSAASELSEMISPEISSTLFFTLADTMPIRALVRFSWFASRGTDSGNSIPLRSTTTGFFQPGRDILPPEYAVPTIFGRAPPAASIRVNSFM